MTEFGFLVGQYFKSAQKEAVRRVFLMRRLVRWRKTTEIRPISSEVGYLPGFVHGSAIYKRGNTVTYYFN